MAIAVQQSCLLIYCACSFGYFLFSAFTMLALDANELGECFLFHGVEEDSLFD